LLDYQINFVGRSDWLLECQNILLFMFERST